MTTILVELILLHNPWATASILMPNITLTLDHGQVVEQAEDALIVLLP